MTNTTTILRVDRSTLPNLYYGYRCPQKDRGLFNDCFVARNIGDPELTLGNHVEMSHAHAADAVSIWNEAHIENDHHDALIENARHKGEALGDALIEDAELTTLRRREAELEQVNRVQQERINRLQSEQISGDDPRLRDFWAQAQRYADNAEYCEVFDRLAEELDGPRRMHSYDLEIETTIRFTITAQGNDADDAYESLSQNQIDDAIKEYVTEVNVEHTLYDYSQD